MLNISWVHDLWQCSIQAAKPSSDIGCELCVRQHVFSTVVIGNTGDEHQAFTCLHGYTGVLHRHPGYYYYYTTTTSSITTTTTTTTNYCSNYYETHYYHSQLHTLKVHGHGQTHSRNFCRFKLDI